MHGRTYLQAHTRCDDQPRFLKEHSMCTPRVQDGDRELLEKLQISYLPSYTPFNHIEKDDCILDHMEESHEMVDHGMHLVFHVLEDCAYKLDENQALDISQRKNELFSRESLFSMEESNEITLVVLTSDEEYAAISLLDEYYRELIQIYSSHTSISAIRWG